MNCMSLPFPQQNRVRRKTRYPGFYLREVRVAWNQNLLEMSFSKSSAIRPRVLQCNLNPISSREDKPLELRDPRGTVEKYHFQLNSSPSSETLDDIELTIVHSSREGNSQSDLRSTSPRFMQPRVLPRFPSVMRWNLKDVADKCNAQVPSIFYGSRQWYNGALHLVYCHQYFCKYCEHQRYA